MKFSVLLVTFFFIKSIVYSQSNTEYHALIFAANDYAYWDDLNRSIPYADSIKKILLQRYNFKSIRLIKNPKLSSIEEAFHSVKQRIKPQDGLFIYYNGHGKNEYDDNYWIPVDAKLKNNSLDSKWFGIKKLRHILNGIDCRHILILTDACEAGGMCIKGSPKSNLYEELDRALLEQRHSALVITSVAKESAINNSDFQLALIDILNQNNVFKLSSADLFNQLNHWRKDKIGEVGYSNMNPQSCHIIGDERIGGCFFFNLKYEIKGEFINGLARTKKNKTWGYINKQGQLVIPFQYEMVNDFSEGLAAVKKNGFWGYINKENQVIIPFQYTRGAPFNNGRARVGTVNTGDFRIDKQGVVHSCTIRLEDEPIRINDDEW